MISQLFEKVKLILLHLLFPSFCCSCRTPVPYNQKVCEKCSVELEKGRVKHPRSRTLYNKRFRIHSVYSYDEDNEAATIVKRLKFANSFNCANFMGEVIADKAASLRREYDIATFVPMSPLAEYDRTFNQCEYVCSCVAKQLGIKEKNCLRKVRYTKKQHKLSSVDRRRNLKDAFRARNNVAGKRILLIDDVTTTGTTLSECANELYKGGAESVTMIAFALTQSNR